MKLLAAKARDGKLTPADYAGGTFTIRRAPTHPPVPVSPITPTPPHPTSLTGTAVAA